MPNILIGGLCTRIKMLLAHWPITVIIMAFLWIFSCLAFVSAAYGKEHTMHTSFSLQSVYYIYTQNEILQCGCSVA